MKSRVFARLIGKAMAGLFAVLLLQGCGLKGDLYLEDGEDPSATIEEQENQEYLEESLEEQTDEVGLDEGTSFDEERTEIFEE
jgi:predicted small lipoprotein YifL